MSILYYVHNNLGNVYHMMLSKKSSIQKYIYSICIKYVKICIENILENVTHRWFSLGDSYFVLYTFLN